MTSALIAVSGALAEAPDLGADLAAVGIQVLGRCDEQTLVQR